MKTTIIQVYPPAHLGFVSWTQMLLSVMLALIYHRFFCHSKTVYHGEAVHLEAVLVGAEFGTGVGMVYAQFLDTEDTKILPKHNYSQKIDKPDEISSLYYTVNATASEVVLVLTANNRSGSKLTYDDHTEHAMNRDIENHFKSDGVISADLLTTPIYVTITLKPDCPPGFGLRTVDTNCDCQEPLYGCHCNKIMEGKQIQCSIENGRGLLNISQKVWIGIVKKRTPPNTENETEPLNNIYFYDNCPFDYCSVKNYSIDLENNPDEQCAENRHGILCGACTEFTSLAIGSNKCIKCDNNDNLALLIFFATAGILVVLFISILNMTVSQGTINGLIFYANILWAYESIFFPSGTESVFKLVDILRVFLAWLNLDFGIKTCFIKDLDAYGKTWLQFVFPFYTWAIVGVVIFLAKFSTQIATLFGKNSIPVLATLLLLSYAKLLNTIMIVLMPADLKIVAENGTIVDSLPVWAYDGNLDYWGMEHALLFGFALLILIFLWLPYTFTLLCIQPIRSGSKYRCLTWVNHKYVKPFLDAYVGPLRSQNHFWVGLLLLVRCILFFIVAATYPNYPWACELSLIIVIILLFLVLYHTHHLYSKPKGQPRYRCQHQVFLPAGISFLTLLEVSFLLNLLLLGVVRLYARFSDTKEGDNMKSEGVICTSVGIALIQFIGIVLYHFVCKLKKVLAPRQVVSMYI